MSRGVSTQCAGCGEPKARALILGLPTRETTLRRLPVDSALDPISILQRNASACGGEGKGGGRGGSSSEISARTGMTQSAKHVS